MSCPRTPRSRTGRRRRAVVASLVAVVLAGGLLSSCSAAGAPVVEQAAPSAGETASVGEVTVTWAKPTEVSQVRWSGAVGSYIAGADLTFADGSSVTVPPADGAAGITQDFAARTTTAVVISVRSASPDDATLAGWFVDAPGSDDAVDEPAGQGAAGGAAAAATDSPTRPAPDGTTSSTAVPATTPTAAAVGDDGPVDAAPAPTADDGSLGTAVRDVTATASSNPDRAGAIIDGDVANGSAGLSWTAGNGDASPSVRLTWAAPRVFSSVMVLGLVQDVYAPENSTAAPLNATLVFDDGSKVAVDGISGIAAEATVIAFSPRTTTSVTVQLRKTQVRATVGLREVSLFSPGVTPPRWSTTTGPTYSVTPAPASCPATPPAGTATTPLQLVCPATGSTVDGSAVVVVRAASSVGSTVVARTWKPTGPSTGSIAVVASAVVGADGTARLSFPTTNLARGPIGIQIRFASATGGRPPTVSLQLVNQTGVVLDSSDHAPAGMTLQWSEEFTSGLSVTQTGHGGTYGAQKNERWGSSEFGSAIFADPSWGLNTLATVGSDYLRIRAQSTNGRPDPNGWGRQHDSGLISSLRQGGSGFAAQYGYFEARMLAPDGIGTWPAFWMMDTSAATSGPQPATEVDAVELYGTNSLGSCHTVHNWNGPDPINPIRCPDPNGFADWSMAWHTYGVRIVPGGAIFYIDGVQVHSSQGLQGSDRPFFFMLNLSLGGGWPVDLSPTGQTADLYVDWVRVYT